jgi:Zn-dependent M28 family amino/carboxypeptidase
MFTSMKKIKLLALGLTGAVSLAFAGSPAPDGISAARLLARTKILASDEFEGRAPGSPGEEKTVAYLVGEFKKMGLAPGNPDGTYIQDVPLVGITSKPTLSFEIAGQTMEMTPINDYVGYTTRVVPHVAVKDSDVVFVGYGVVAPEYNWDDYKGVDVRGKTVVMLVNDPPVRDPKTGQLDPKIFGGNAMTYYGRWMYKYDIAAAKGAAACIIVHETVPAAYPFAVIIASNSRENFTLRTPDGNAGNVALNGWFTLDAARKLFAACGQDYFKLKASAVRRDFHPVALGAKASFAIANTMRNVDSKNVIAKLTGADPQLRHEYVIYTAHWDHLGRNPALKGDQIYNGADDNASGVATLLEVAQMFAELPAAQHPRRTVIFLSVTAEEKGLLGSRFYTHNPLYPLEHTLANINTDGANYYGRTRDARIIGLGASTLDDIATDVARSQGRTITPDQAPEKGSYYRSDHFEFAKLGVPSLYPKRGLDYIGQPAGWGTKFEADFDLKDYHKVSDEVRPDWTFEGGAQDVAFLTELIKRVADTDTWPTWRPGNEFKAKRDAMLAGPKP